MTDSTSTTRMPDSTTSTQHTEQQPTDGDVLDILDVQEQSQPAGSEPAGSEPAGSEPAGSEPAGSEAPPSEPGAGGTLADTEPDAHDDAGTHSPVDAPAPELERDEAVGDTEGAGATPSSAPKRSRAQLLEREGEVAADFLETLLDIADLDGDIEVDIDGDRAAVAVVDSDEGRVPRRLVGAQGKVLEALQELTRLAVQTATGERSRLMLDVAGHRAARRTALVEIAKEAIADVKSTGLQKALEDMTAFERKVVHDEVAAAGLDSESEGVEPHRHIVILPV